MVTREFCTGASAMIRWRRMGVRVGVVLLLALCIGAASGTPAKAWKMKTHAYSANLILEEVSRSGGKVSIDGYGTFPVIPEYLAAIRAYPLAYRAGAIGPDGFPDMYVGQAFIHPAPNDALTEGTFTDEWLQQQWDNVQKMPAGADRQMALAFMLGMLTHAAGDLFGHDYINQLARGVFPAIKDAVTDPALMRIIARHNIAEAYIDAKIPARYVQTKGLGFETYMRITAPEGFVLNSLYTNGGVANGMNPLTRYFSSKPQPLKWALDMRVELVQECASLRAKGAPSWLVHPIYTAQLRYCEAWIRDIDMGITAWVATNQVVAQKLLVGDYGAAKSALTEWAIHHGISMAGAPDGVGDLIGWISDLGAWVSSLMPQAVKDAIKDFKENVIYDTIAWEALGMRWSEIEALGTPEPWLSGKSWRGGPALFAPNVRAQMDKDMGNYGHEIVNANSSTFKPFHNTVVMSKLVLMGPEGVNALLAQAGSRSRISQNVMLGWMRSLDGSQSWEDGSRTRPVFDPVKPFRPAGPVVHIPLYDERKLWCSLFTGFSTGLTGGRFEEWKSDGVPMEWRYSSWNGSGGRCGLTTMPKHGGKYSVSLSNPSPDGTKDSDIWSPFVARPGMLYTASVWAATNRDPATVQMHLEFVDAAGTPTYASTSGDKWGVVRGSGTMKLMSVTSQAPPGAVGGRVYLRLKGGALTGSATFDDAHVVEGIPVSLSAPKAAGKPSVARGTTLVGTVRPAHVARVSLKVQKLSSGRYIGFKTCKLSSSAAGAWKYRAWLNRGRYRVRALTAADGTYAAAVSHWSKLVVR